MVEIACSDSVPWSLAHQLISPLCSITERGALFKPQTGPTSPPEPASLYTSALLGEILNLLLELSEGLDTGPSYHQTFILSVGAPLERKDGFLPPSLLGIKRTVSCS